MHKQEVLVRKADVEIIDIPKGWENFLLGGGIISYTGSEIVSSLHKTVCFSFFLI